MWLFLVVVYVVPANGQSKSSSLKSGTCDQRKFGGELICCNEGTECQSPNGVCYCDRTCEETGDCCDDIEETRQACSAPDKNCVVSSWSSWTTCKNSKGVCVREKRRRSRNIEQSSTGLGNKCPHITQARICPECVFTRTTHILPYKYNRPQSFGFENILPAEQYDSKKYSPSCAEYKIVNYHSNCPENVKQVLNKMNSTTVCVECQPRIMNDGKCKHEGHAGERLRWQLHDPSQKGHCSGFWFRLSSKITNCRCSENMKYKNAVNFIFM